jgi:hypothetical protein
MISKIFAQLTPFGGGNNGISDVQFFEWKKQPNINHGIEFFRTHVSIQEDFDVQSVILLVVF